MQPDPSTRERLLATLADFVARGGAAPLMLAPVAPGGAAFPEPWAPTRSGVMLLLRRLMWHAGLDREVELEDRRAGAPPTERKPATRLELIEVHRRHARFALGFVGEDDVVGTLAHEVGLVHAVLHRPDDADPYRSAEAPVLAVDPDRDLARGAIATVYVGLGVVAANAAYQQYSRPGGNPYEPLQYDVLQAGHVPMSELAFLLAVQAVVRADAAPPDGLEPPQRDEVAAWIGVLRDEAARLRERLGIPADAQRGTRPTVVRFADAVLEPEAPPRRNAFRWVTNRGGIGFVTGTVLGIGMSLAVSRGMMPLSTLAGGLGGHVIGRRVRVPRCSACATVIPDQATTCRKCGSVLRGEIAKLSDRLEAEERLGEDELPPASSG